MAQSCKVAREVAAKDLAKDTPVAVSLAARSGAKRDLPLSLAKLSAKEWAVNLGAAKTIQEVADAATQSLDGESDRAAKVKETLLYLNRFLEAPAAR
jgi:hypothetical protein